MVMRAGEVVASYCPQTRQNCEEALEKCKNLCDTVCFPHPTPGPIFGRLQGLKYKVAASTSSRLAHSIGTGPIEIPSRDPPR